MKYHFKIINTATNEVVEDSAEYREGSFEGWNTKYAALVTGECSKTDDYQDKPEYNVVVYPVAETVVEEDESIDQYDNNGMGPNHWKID